MDEALALRAGAGFGPIGGIHLLEDVGDVSLYGPVADAEDGDGLLGLRFEFVAEAFEVVLGAAAAGDVADDGEHFVSGDGGESSFEGLEPGPGREVVLEFLQCVGAECELYLYFDLFGDLRRQDIGGLLPMNSPGGTSGSRSDAGRTSRKVASALMRNTMSGVPLRSAPTVD